MMASKAVARAVMVTAVSSLFSVPKFREGLGRLLCAGAVRAL
jgi:hypothetical protein